MEQTLRSSHGEDRKDAGNSYELEQQLEAAERRYAEARGASTKAREEWRAISVQPGATPAAIEAARARFDAIAARCKRLHDLIDSLEAKLDL
ncbi:MAG TPA: hypothetical protein VMF52_11890 [Steroidobacteraceae bacterium]|nr:hypothetical protein [Steroidobacteraceae bacterium]